MLSLGCSSPTWGLCSQARAGTDQSETRAESYPNLRKDEVSPPAPCSRRLWKTGSPHRYPGPRRQELAPLSSTGGRGRTWFQVTPLGGERWGAHLTPGCPPIWHANGSRRNVPYARKCPGRVVRLRSGLCDMETPWRAVGQGPPPPSSILHHFVLLTPSLPAAPPPASSGLT